MGYDWSRAREALEEAAPVVAEAHFTTLGADGPVWQPTPIALGEDESFTVYATGRIVLSEEAGLWNGPRLYLWSRVGGQGPLLNGTQDTATFEAPRDGKLELALGLSEWTGDDGDVADDAPRVGSGAIEVLVVRWRGDAAEGVAALAAAAPEEPLFAAERERLAHPVARPSGWAYLWSVGEADIFTPDAEAGSPAIRAHTRDDVGIITTPIDFPLGEDTRVRWRWRVDALPSEVAEDSLPTHDYLSLAVQFENGQDLTYYWSAALPPGTHYRCPLPGWDRRETHWVLRSGSEGLGAWHEEERPVLADYREAVGAPPERIVAIWLIAVSLFQKREGSAVFADVAIEDGEGSVQVIRPAR